MRAALDSRKGWKARYFLADRSFRNGDVERAVLIADDRVAFVPEFMKIRVVDPDVLCKLELPHEARTNHEGGNPSINSVLGRAVRQEGPIGCAAADHLAPLHVGGGVAWVHPPNVRTERNGITVRVHLGIIEVIVALGIGGERRIVLFRRKNERSPTAPAAHQFRGNEVLLLKRPAVLSQEIAKPADVLLQSAVSHIAAIPRKDSG